MKTFEELRDEASQLYRVQSRDAYSDERSFRAGADWCRDQLATTVFGALFESLERERDSLRKEVEVLREFAKNNNVPGQSLGRCDLLDEADRIRDEREKR